MVRKGRLVRSWTNYILGSDHRILQNVSIWYPRHKSDTLMVIGCLYKSSLREHLCYLGHRMCLLLHPTSRKTWTRADNIFAELRHVILKPYERVACHNSWILVETWRLVK